MALSYVQYAGNGTETNFSVTFPYLDKSHIVVKVDGSPVAFTWNNSTTVNITPAPGVGTVVDLRRDTPAITPVVDFTDGSIVTEDQLDTNARQALFVSQEAQDISADAMVRDATGSWNATGSRIGNVADPINDQDVVTKAAVVVLTASAVADAQGHATSASGSASMADAAKIEAELHADDAHESALQAAASAASAAASFDAFDDRYLGAKSSAPTVDNDGAPLLIGALYYDTVVGLMRQWDGASWLDLAAGISQTSGDARYVRQAGDTMTGALTLPNSSPSNDNHAARKKYVDDQLAAILDMLPKTGDFIITTRSDARAGWVKINDGTLSKAGSGGTTLASAAAQPLYEHLWNNFSNTLCPVSTGRGASAAADFAAGKTLTMTAMLGRALVVAGAGAGLTSRTLGDVFGNETSTTTTHVGNAGVGYGYGGDYGVGLVGTYGSAAFSVMQPSTFINIFIKL